MTKAVGGKVGAGGWQGWGRWEARVGQVGDKVGGGWGGINLVIR